MNKYKAVGFDHTGVIVGIPAIKFHKIISEALQVDVEDFNTAFRHYNTAYNQGETTKEEFWKSILKELKRESFYDEAMRVVEKPREINIDVINVIKELKKSGYKVGLLSNDTREAALPIRAEEQLDKLFNVVCVAAETHLLKPNKDAFDDFMNKLGVSPNELVFVDDSKLILDGAEKLGISTILCVEPEGIRKQLQEKEIL